MTELVKNADYFKSQQMGSDAEALFPAAIQAVGGKFVRKATTQEDREEHWDYLVELEGKLYRVDVKAMKAFKRGGQPQATYVCLELHGSHPNNPGWLYGGEADLIAFQTTWGFVLAYRKGLCEAAAALVNTRSFVNYSHEAIYKVYNRRDSELVSWLELGKLIDHPGVLFRVVKR